MASNWKNLHFGDGRHPGFNGLCPVQDMPPLMYLYGMLHLAATIYSSDEQLCVDRQKQGKWWP
jgi:hypothetical protein